MRLQDAEKLISAAIRIELGELDQAAYETFTAPANPNVMVSPVAPWGELPLRIQAMWKQVALEVSVLLLKRINGAA